MTAAWAGLLLGLAGSGHCAAMCGPLVLLAPPHAGPGGAAAAASMGRHVVLYHAGRLTTYLAMGLAAGLAGGAIASAGLGRWLAIAAGSMLIVSAVRGTGRLRTPATHANLGGLLTRALGRAAVWMRQHRVQGPLIVGALNGLLPCGLVYTVAVAAAGFGGTADAVGVMGGFGFGTVPVLAAIAFCGGRVAARIPPRLRRMAPVAVALAGVLLLARGAGFPGHDPVTHAAPGLPGDHTHAPHAHQ
jgi:sulfite exporter TauE/SafE